MLEWDASAAEPAKGLGGGGCLKRRWEITLRGFYRQGWHSASDSTWSSFNRQIDWEQCEAIKHWTAGDHSRQNQVVVLFCPSSALSSASSPPLPSTLLLFRLSWQPHSDPLVLGCCGEVQQRATAQTAAGNTACWRGTRCMHDDPVWSPGCTATQRCTTKRKDVNYFWERVVDRCLKCNIFFFMILALFLFCLFPPFSLWPAPPVFLTRDSPLYGAVMDPAGFVWRSGGK